MQIYYELKANMPKTKPTVVYLIHLSHNRQILETVLHYLSIFSVFLSVWYFLQALRFYGSSNVIVAGITIRNSPQTHLKFDACSTVQVFDFSVSSPAESPNTDGIHLQNSQDIAIYRTKLACGNSGYLAIGLLPYGIN